MNVDDGDGICMRPQFKPTNDSPSLWDGAVHREPTAVRYARQREARVWCRRCPLLEACEAYLSDLEAQGLRVDGIVAGRLSDVPGYTGSTEHQRRCLGCGGYLIPRAAKYTRQKGLRHLGEGLCENCYPILRRWKGAN